MSDRGGSVPLRVGVIGLGAIGTVVAGSASQLPDLALAGVLVRETSLAAARARLPQETVVTTAEALAELAPDVVVECGGHSSVTQHVEPLLHRGIDVYLISTGALTDDALLARLRDAAAYGGGRLVIPAGAIAGLDGLGALALGRLDEVRYTSSKPPLAWAGTPAEQVLDLRACTRGTEFFRGTAREAATRFPMNANLAATVALAGIGLDRTEVALVADPAIEGNVGIVEASGSLGSLRLELAGPAALGNPRTSAITAYSLVHAIRRRTATVVI